MPTVSIARSDLFPVGTTVGIYPAGSQRGGQTPAGGPPTSAVIATGVVDAAGNLSVTNAGILSYTPYVAYALVNGEHRYARLRSTLDIFDGGVATFTADTASGAATLLNVSVSVGAVAIGQRVEGVGIPAGHVHHLRLGCVLGDVGQGDGDRFGRDAARARRVSVGDGWRAGCRCDAAAAYAVDALAGAGHAAQGDGGDELMLGIVNTAAAGDTTLVAAVTGKKIRVKKFQLVNGVATANNVKFRTGTTDLHAALPLPLAAGLSIEAEDDGDGPDDFLFETTAGALLAINLSAATGVSGTFTYSLE
jgi:hypothetical protein